MNVVLQPAGSDVDASLHAYRSHGGYQAWESCRCQSAERLLEVIEESRLCGKGGAGFPVHKKMRLMRAQSAEKKYLVINGSEHEPGSLKDRYLLEQNPHKVLEGALVAAHAVGASDVVIAINEASAAAVACFRRALLDASGDSGIDFDGVTVILRTVPDIYIVGDESALLEVLEDKKPLPRKKPPFPIQQGLHGSPTLIHNVETVAHLPFIARAGAAAYRSLGRNGAGVTLVTLDSEFTNSGVYEIPLGTPIREIIYIIGGGLKDGSRIKALQPGGPSCGFLSPAQFDLPLDAETLKANGSALGCAVIRAYSVNDCMVHAIGGIMHFFADGSCGQCPRCRMETTMLDTIVRQILAGNGSSKLLDQVEKLIALAQGEGICSLIAMPVAPIRSGLALFADEFAAHLDRRCELCATRAAEIACADRQRIANGTA